MSTITATHDVTDVLKRNFHGEVLLPETPGYDQARTLWNAMIDKRPAAIIRCADVADVVAAVAFARERHLDLAVRGGGHNIAGNALCDAGLVIDLSAMKEVKVDPDTRRAHVQPGATLAEVDRETQKHGLAVPVGINSTTGIAGLTLGGGFGWLSRRFGMTVDNLVSAQVVLADGRTVTADETEHADLFWALRGGGGNFGIVTNFEFKLHPVGPEIFAGLMVFPLVHAQTVLRKYRAFIAEAPPELNVWAILRAAPPLPFLPKEVHGQGIIALAVCYSGKPSDALRYLEPVRQFAPMVGEHLGPMPFTAWQQAFDGLLAPGARNYWKSHNFSALPDAALDLLVAFAGRLPSLQCEIFLGALGGAAARPPANAMAYGNRDANFVINVHGRWDGARNDAPCMAWAREFFQAAAPYATGGVYVNFLTADETSRTSAAYGPNFARLQEIKARYDAENLFHINQNIPPRAPVGTVPKSG